MPILDALKSSLINAHHMMILKCIDERVHHAAKQHGLEACDGMTVFRVRAPRFAQVRPCSVVSMHTVAVKLAHAIATLLVDPQTDAGHTKATDALDDFRNEWRALTVPK